MIWYGILHSQKISEVTYYIKMLSFSANAAADIRLFFFLKLKSPTFLSVNTKVYLNVFSLSIGTEAAVPHAAQSPCN